jgi:type IV pilus assembly protein PilF
VRRTEPALVALAILAILAGCAGSPSRSGAASSQGRDDNAAALQVKLGQGYLAQGELETARDKLQRALELDPQSADAHTVMALLQERINRPSMAEKHYRRAVELKPADGSTNNNYGTFLCNTGRHADAQLHFDRAVQDPFYRTPEVAYANAGFCALKSGDAALAERMLRAALTLEPGNATVLYEMARLHFERGDLMRARAFLQRFEGTAVADPHALELGARIEQQRGDSAAARRYRQQLQELFPDFIPATGSDGSGS